MNITAGVSVGDVIEHVPAAETVFEIVRIDSCCRRDRTLAEASAAAGIDVDEVISLLRELSLDSTTHPTALRADATLPDVTAQIRDQYHRRTRAFLVMLTRSVRALAGSHGHAFPELATVQSSIEQLARDLVPHMSREEKYLFPYIDSLAGGHADREIVVPLFGKVEYPLEFVKHDHSDDMQLIATLRDATRTFTPPDGACAGFRAFYSLLRQFATELEEHIKLENDILFPRAMEAERRLFQRADS
jgi:regulator of cell morphogenesis and NO signaling